MVSEHNVIIIVVLNIMETLIVLRKIICSSNLHDSEINVKGKKIRRLMAKPCTGVCK